MPMHHIVSYHENEQSPTDWSPVIQLARNHTLASSRLARADFTFRLKAPWNQTTQLAEYLFTYIPSSSVLNYILINLNTFGECKVRIKLMKKCTYVGATLRHNS